MRLEERLRRVRLLVVDVDGVLTDGRIHIGGSGEELFKSFDVRDGEGLKLVRKAGIRTAIISGRRSGAVESRARELLVDEVALGVEDKLAALKGIASRLSIRPEEIAYVGDDVGDIGPMSYCGLPIAVADAHEKVKRVALHITSKPGGKGAVREVCDMILSAKEGRCGGKVRIVRVGDIEIGGGGPIALIAGPCVIESRDHALMMAERIKRIAERSGIPFIFKSSFDKANRSSIRSYRGPGLEEGLRVLEEVKREVGVPVLSDIHTPDQAGPASEVLDVIQIPAFLCRQTDLLLAAGRTGKPINVKKGQFMAPWDMGNVVEKIESTGNPNVMLTERGSCFGYNNLVVDMRSIPVMRGLGCPVIFDATHSVQLPGGLGASSGGQREFVPYLARAAAAMGIDGLFMEVHDRPDEAPCDGPNMVDPETLESILKQVKAIDELVKGMHG